MTSYEQKFGKKANISPKSFAMLGMVKFNIAAGENSKTMYKFSEAMALARKANNQHILDEFILERDGAFYKYNFDKEVWTLDCLVNPDVQPENYRVTFEDDEGHAVMAQPVSWYEAERIVRRFCGCIVYETGKNIPVYIDPMPDDNYSELF